MSQVSRLRMAKQCAETFLEQEGITSLPVNPFAIAASRDIIIEAKPDTTDGVSGMLLRHGDAFGILYATHIPSKGFQNFSIAHELGHYFLDGHIDHVLPKDGIHTSHAGFVSPDPYELEADHFAAGLLMPSGLFKRALGRRDPGLDTIEAIATDCQTSLTATAIRYAELTDDAVAVIISTDQTIDYCFLSDAMKSLPELSWLRKGHPVPKGTETARLNADSGRIRNSDRAVNEIDVMDWLGGRRSALVTEEVLGLGTYGKTLTVLSSVSIGHEDEAEVGDDEAELLESWTPRFHR
ncbi:MAG: ImmA/IrrE family metallo-endopeptidase [Candidatus Accumulibacter sp.]|uniref:ImmA/IrrE family metallo-endopeptidase n=1 Tax=Accumulibacter sp. TaxID=2053492 RepID=UPI0025E2F2B1|nr:ImmA/IrrE family metallo-endopeptidase [Accumulibacter sp.]MCM8597573.1 ImmA/IrrE family metallo-endopeptidase [Accumulibacter sp.]